MPLDAIVVLGCRVPAQGSLRGAAARRVARAALAYAQGVAPVVIASGGKAWGGTLEACAMTDELVRLGVPRRHILREERSISTLQNARFVARMAGERLLGQLAVVTCDWHMQRALAAFRWYGFRALPLAAPAPPVTRWRGLLRAADERRALVFDRCLAELKGFE